MKDLDISKLGPYFPGIFVIIFGLFLLTLAISNPDWFFSDEKSFNIEKIKGWINLFGRNTTRFIMVIMAIISILFGIFWLWHSSHK